MSNYGWHLIVCVDEKNGIGKKTTNSIVWQLPEDMKRFRRLTTGHVVIMGRKTLQSIGKPLPKRDNIILSNSYTEVFDSDGHRNLIPNKMSPENLHEFLKHDNYKNKTIWVIGGAEIYKFLMPYCNRLYVTEIYKNFNCDVIFPTIDDTEWKLESKSENYYSDLEGLTYCYKDYLRK